MSGQEPPDMIGVLWHELSDIERRVGRSEHSVEERLRRLEDRALAQDARSSEHQAGQERFLKRYPVLVWTVGMAVSLVSLVITLLHH